MSTQLRGALRAVSEGVIIRVDVSPGSCDSGVTKYDAWRQTICIKLTKHARMGKANDQLARYLAQLFNKGVDDVHLISGHKSSRKVVLLRNISIGEVESIMNAKMEDS